MRRILPSIPGTLCPANSDKPAPQDALAVDAAITSVVDLQISHGRHQITLDTTGAPVSLIGGLHWRDRGDAPDVAPGWLAEDFVKNNAGLIRVTVATYTETANPLTTTRRLYQIRQN